jgi:hypothetical protein
VLGAAPPLQDWQSFYVVVGGSAGALTGLMFVVIALRREGYTANAARAMRTFATPTIVHFTMTVALAALLSMPHLSRSGVSVILLAIGVPLLAYVAWLFRNARQIEAYKYDLEDLVWHFCLPALAYASILVAGLITWSSPHTSLYIVAAGMLVLLVSGIHNAWDSAVWTIVRQSSG